MAALLETLRDYQRNPVMSRQEREAAFGVQIPKRQRSSLSSKQQINAGNRRQERQAMAAVRADEFQEEVSQGHKIPRRRPVNTDRLQQVEHVYAASPFWVEAGKKLAILVGALTVLYTVIFLLAFAFVWIGNLVQFGPVHTSYTNTTINGQPTRITTSNDGGIITVTMKITQKDGSLLLRSYAGPTLNPDLWNDDLGGIVATSQVASDGQTILVHLVGEINYFHPFLVRPSQDFSLVPDRQAGYKVVQS